MSYCRWSTDDFQCDLYIYADVSGGYTTHIAARRRVFKVPLPDKVPLTKDGIEVWIKRQQIMSEILEDETKFDWADINLPYAGETFNMGCQETVDFLRKLRRLGYKFPEGVEEDILEDDENEDEL